MDSSDEGDLSARILLRNVLHTEIQKSPVTRSMSQALELSSVRTRSQHKRRSSTLLVSPQQTLRKRLRQKLHDIANTSPIQHSKRRSGTIQKAQTPSAPASDLDDFTPRHLLRGILQTEPEVSLLLPERHVVDDAEPRSAETSLSSNRPSTGMSNLDLPDLTTANLTEVMKGISRRRPKRNINVSVFERKLNREDEEKERESDMTDNLSMHSGVSDSSHNLSLKTPFVDLRSDRRGLKRKAVNRRVIDVQDFEEGVQNQIARRNGPDMEQSVHPANKTCVLEKFTLGLSSASAFDYTDIAQNNTALYPHPISLDDKDTATTQLKKVDENGIEMKIDATGQMMEDESLKADCCNISAQEEMASQRDGLIDEEARGLEEDIIEDSQNEIIREPIDEDDLEREDGAEKMETHQDEAEEMGTDSGEDTDGVNGASPAQDKMTTQDLKAEATKHIARHRAFRSEGGLKPVVLKTRRDYRSMTGDHRKSETLDKSGKEEYDWAINGEVGEDGNGSPVQRRSRATAGRSLLPDWSQNKQIPESHGRSHWRPEDEANQSTNSECQSSAHNRSVPSPGFLNIEDSPVLENLQQKQKEDQESLQENPEEEEEPVLDHQEEEEEEEELVLDHQEDEEEEELVLDHQEDEEEEEPVLDHQEDEEEEEPVLGHQEEEEEPVLGHQEEEEEPVLDHQEEEEEEPVLDHQAEKPVLEEESQDGESDDDDTQSEELSMKTPAFVRERKRIQTSSLLPTSNVLKEMMNARPSTAETAQDVKAKQKKRKPRASAQESGLPKSYVMSAFKHFARTRVSSDVYPVLKDIMEKYFDRLSDDLEAYAAHAGRKTIEVEDVVLLLRRQGFVTDTVPVNVLIEKFLPLEYRKLLIPAATSGNKVVPKQKR